MQFFVLFSFFSFSFLSFFLFSFYPISLQPSQRLAKVADRRWGMRRPHQASCRFGEGISALTISEQGRHAHAYLASPSPSPSPCSHHITSCCVALPRITALHCGPQPLSPIIEALAPEEEKRKKWKKSKFKKKGKNCSCQCWLCHVGWPALTGPQHQWFFFKID